MKSSYQNMDEIKRMQQEAIKRVQEMQKRANRTLEVSTRHNVPNQENKNAVTIKKEIDQKDKHEPIPILPKNMAVQKKTIPPLPFNNIFDIFTKDSEKTLILVLIFLLIEEGTDMGLILALMYLVM